MFVKTGLVLNVVHPCFCFYIAYDIRVSFFLGFMFFLLQSFVQEDQPGVACPIFHIFLVTRAGAWRKLLLLFLRCYLIAWGLLAYSSTIFGFGYQTS